MWWKWGHMQRCAIISFCPGIGYGPRRKKIILLRAAVEREKEKNKCENQQHCNPITNIRWHRDPNFVSTQIFQDLAGFFGLRVCLGIEPGFCCLCARRPWWMISISVGKVTRVKLFCLFVCARWWNSKRGNKRANGWKGSGVYRESENGCSISSCIWPSSRWYLMWLTTWACIRIVYALFANFLDRPSQF